MPLDPQTEAMVERFSAGTAGPEELCALASALARAVERQVDDKVVWYTLIGVVAAMDDGAAALGLVAAAAERFEHAAMVCRQVCAWLYRIKKYAAIKTLHDVASERTVVRLVASYYMGCIAFTEDRKAEAHRYLDFFRDHAAPLLEQFLVDPGLNVIYRQGTLVRAPEHVEALRAAPPPAPVTDLSFVRTAIEPRADDRPIYMCSADRKYIAAMLPAFLAQSPPEPADIVVVACNVEAEDLAFIDAQCRLYPAFRIDVVAMRSEVRGATFYSCARFYALQAVLSRHGRRVVSLDIDCALTAEGRRQLEAVPAEIDFACFRSRRDEPASYYQAGIMLWGTSPPTRQFLDLVCLFCSERSAENSLLTWMLDQAALFSVLHYMAERAIPLRFVTLNHLLGRPLADITVSTWDGSINKGELRGAFLSRVDGALVVSEF